MNSPIVRVALTGGIATGKSHCLAKFATLGVPTIDADRLAHDAVEPGSHGLAAVLRRFGSNLVLPNGQLDRAALGRLVFADASARLDLEAIIHPIVYASIARWFSTLGANEAFGVADIPLLFETEREGDFDCVIVTACRPEQQLERLQARGLTDLEARQRLDAQMPLAEKLGRATHVIDTSGTLAETDRQVEELVQKMRRT